MIFWAVCLTVALFAMSLYVTYQQGFRAGQEDVLGRVVPPLDKRADMAVAYERTLSVIADAGKASGDPGDPQTIARAALRCVRGHS